MPRLIPEEPDFTTASEREVWTRLRDTLRDEDVLVAGWRVTDPRKDHEIDLLLLMPGVGIVAVEVKGGDVTCVDGTWWLRAGGRTARRIHPVRQVREARYAARGYLERDDRWRDSARSRVRWAHAVVLPYSTIPPDRELPDAPRWLLHDRDDLPELAARIAAIPLQQDTDHRVPTREDCDLAVEILTARGTSITTSVVGRAEEREAVATRLTQEQAALLRVTRLMRRVEVRGGAGSGKTVLALTQARELSAGRDDRSPERVALLCYSMGLAAYLRRETQTWPHRQRPAFVGTYEDLANGWGIASGSREDPDFWEEHLPALMADAARELPDGQRFDAIVVDEAQDFADSWWVPLIASLRDEEEGGLYVYSDENQRIFQRFGRPPVPLVPLVLDHNLRNTRQIATVFAPLAPLRMRTKGGDGPDVVVVPTPAQEAIDVADDQVDLLLDEGWLPEHLALLTTGARHPAQAQLQQDAGQSGYWETYWDPEQVFYGHVLGCKGLERRAVILAVNEDVVGGEVRPRSKERLYVGLSRATDRLVVVGDADVIAQMGGPVVAERLGI